MSNRSLKEITDRLLRHGNYSKDAIEYTIYQNSEREFSELFNVSEKDDILKHKKALAHIKDNNTRRDILLDEYCSITQNNFKGIEDKYKNKITGITKRDDSLFIKSIAEEHDYGYVVLLRTILTIDKKDIHLSFNDARSCGLDKSSTRVSSLSDVLQILHVS